MRNKSIYKLSIILGMVLILLSSLLTSHYLLGAKSGLNKMSKVLVLIIASDDTPIYIETQKIWRAYMHSDLDHVEAYFIKGNPNLAEKYKIDGDTIWSRTVENLKPGILNKTILSLECMLPRIKAGEFSYILRTESTSFYVYSNLLRHLKNCPRKNFYGGSDIGISYIGAGSGFLLSPDMAELLVKNSSVLINKAGYLDDVEIGHFFHKHNIGLKRHSRVNIYKLSDFNSAIKINEIIENEFHYRVKNENHDLRMTDDMYVYGKLLEKFYGKRLE
ncbi:MAG TPA: hypothetical protein VJJ81_01855 [Candidatus Babeliales bacterium]|nr:hypothetical protein [Candidatus Babeliales bacterium]